MTATPPRSSAAGPSGMAPRSSLRASSSSPGLPAPPAPGGGGGGTTTNESGGGRSCQVGSAGCAYPVSCPPEAAGSCNGDASNQTGGSRSAAVAVVWPAAAKRLFNTVKFSVPAGKTKKLTLKPTPAGKKLLRKKHKFKT